MNKGILLLLLLSLSFLMTFGQGTDNANDAAYNSGWTNGSDGGSGFGAWSLDPSTNGSTGGFFIGTSDIDVSGESWGVYANNGVTSSAVRSFDASPSALDRVSIKMDNGNINNGGVVGIGLRNSSGENLLEIYFRGGEANYIINEATGEKDSNLGYSSTGIQIDITFPTATTYSAKLTQLVGGTSETITGSLINPAGGQVISQFRIFNFNAGSGSSSDQFFNCLSHEIDFLPVELIHFSGKTDNEKAYLTWSTASETNNSYFEIERSLNTKNWQSIGKIYGKGNSLERTNYEFVDQSPLKGNNYYRLRQVDFDGSHEFSNIVTIIFNQKELDNTLIYPTLVENELTIQNGIGKVLLYNFSGKLVRTFQISEKTFSLNTSNLTNGRYSLIILRENKSVGLFSFMK